MHFMADVFVPCEECEGKRYNAETLEVRYKGKNISEVLDMTVDDAILFFDAAPQLGEKLWILSKVGLGYLTLGQPSNTLSGGEAQRIKIARELVESAGQRNLYIMDEPTTGLHMSDVDRLLERSRRARRRRAHGRRHRAQHGSDRLGGLRRSTSGRAGGTTGGTVIACGPPESIVQSKSRSRENILARISPGTEVARDENPGNGRSGVHRKRRDRVSARGRSRGRRRRPSVDGTSRRDREEA